MLSKIKLAARRRTCANGLRQKLPSAGLVPWLAICFGCGVILYFAIDREPAVWATLVLVAGAVTIAVLLRHRPLAFPLALGFAAAACGFTAPTIKCAVIAHPVLSGPLWNVEIAGFVEMREERERSTASPCASRG